MEIVTSGSSKTLTLSGGSYSGIKIFGYYVATTANQDDAAALLDASKVNIRIHYKMEGASPEEVYSGPLHLIAQFCEYKTGLFTDANAMASATSRVFLAHGSGVNGIWSQGFNIDFGQVFNLKGKDQLTCELQITSGAFGSDIATATSYLAMEAEEGVGVGTYIPKYRYYAVEGSSAKFDENFGDNVTDIVYLNFDKSGITLANRVLDNVFIASDKKSFTKTYHQVVNERVGMFEDTTSAANRNQCWLLYSTVRGNVYADNTAEIDKVNCKLDLVSSNITASKNFVIVRFCDFKPEIAQRAAQMLSEHSEANIRKVLG